MSRGLAHHKWWDSAARDRQECLPHRAGRNGRPTTDQPDQTAKICSMPHTSNHVLLEVCIASVDDAVTAAAGAADRLELNASLALGGLTPSAGSIAEVRRAVDLP